MAHLPNKQALLAWLENTPGTPSKRDIAKAFGIKGADRIDLKRMLNDLEAQGLLKKRQKSADDPNILPPVAVLTILPPDDAGDLFASPAQWRGTGPEPRILFLARATDPAIGAGDRVLARLQSVEGEDHAYIARLIRKIGSNPKKILGIFRKTTQGGRIAPIAKGADKQWQVHRKDMHDARDGELVEAEQTGPKGRMGLPMARIITRLGDPGAPKSVSLIAIHDHGIPDHFSDAAMAESDRAAPLDMGTRTDLTHLPFVTIDPADARDHDDACYAHADDATDNPGGHVIWVAIADVAAYVRPGTPLDAEAQKRGNSTYFPDRVVPMLPQGLSADLCSLHQGVMRPVIAVRMRINAQGEKIGHDFTRGMITSVASLTYEQAAQGLDGAADAQTAPLVDPVLRPLDAAYRALSQARNARQPLALDLPERQIILNDQGKVTSVAFKDRLDTHRLIEDFMVLANVAAAQTLIKKRQPLLFRVHEEPSPEKMAALRDTAQASGFTLPKGQVVQTRHLNDLLIAARNSEFSELINLTTLRSMQQAYYFPENFGHFGLALQSYAHFTSPIRRYADLIVHRALISAHGWGDDGMTPELAERLGDVGKHISDTERRSMAAERDTNDRYLAAYLSDRVGATFQGRISGVARFGAFVKLIETGAEGVLPIRHLGREYFHFDADAHTLIGSQTGLTIAIGARVVVKLQQAVAATGGLQFDLIEIEGTPAPRPRSRKGGGYGRKTPTGGRKAGAHKKRAIKLRKKTARRRQT